MSASIKLSRLAICIGGILASMSGAHAELVNIQHGKPVHGVNDKGVPTVTGAEFSAVSVPFIVDVNLAELPPVQQWQPGDPIVSIPRLRGEPAIVDPQAVNPTAGRDPLLAAQENFDATRGAFDFTVPLVNIPGLVSGSNPHDANGEVGPDYFVQTINGAGGSQVQFYDKTTGDPVGNAFSLASLPSAAGACANGLGDPVPLYDEIANRWVLTEFSTQAGRSLCVYVARTDDPINGGYYGYQFQTPDFPDYPKYGVWNDAYYVGANESTSSLIALDRDAMLAGQPATMQRFTIVDPAAFSFAMIPPVDHDGLMPPPSGEPGIFIRHFDDEAHDPSNNDPANDFLQIWEFEVDFDTPANSQIVGPNNIAIADFDSEQCGFTAFACYPQPGTTTTLDPLREVVMNFPKYRNFGSHEVLVGNLTTDVDDTDHGGVRWFELRRSGGSDWTVHQEGTYAPDIADADGATEHRWMGASAMDSSGNIALAYSISNDTNLFPSMAYTGRLAADPMGVMTQDETFIIQGTGNHTSSTRWGDYASMSVDPVDGCTFWVTNNYGQSGGSTALTQIASFRFDDCGDPTFTLSADNTEQEICLMNPPVAINNVDINVGSINGFANNVTLAFNPTPPAAFNLNINPTGVLPPGMSTVSGMINAGLTPGVHPVTVEGNAAGVDARTLELMFDVATVIPNMSVLQMPANNAMDVGTMPTLTWSAADQAGEYSIEIATDVDFNNIVYTATATGTSHQVAMPLANSTAFFWRVTANNQCGTGQASDFARFTTVAAPGDCPVGVTPNVVYSDDVENGPAGWTTGGNGSTWAISTARPFSGTSSWFAQDVTTVSDQYLISPEITLPNSDFPISLSYYNFRDIEENGANCWDAGALEITTDGGSNWTQLIDEILLDEYTGTVSGNTNPLAGQPGWCNLQDFTRALADLNNFAGETVQFRFRLGTDGSVGEEGWYLDDFQVQSCPAGSEVVLDDGFEAIVR